MSTPTIHWVPDTGTFAVRLVLVRHQMGWNAKEAALACGISPQSWREWELSGRRPRDYEGICKQIAAYTQCDLIWLMTGTPSPSGWTPGGTSHSKTPQQTDYPPDSMATPLRPAIFDRICA